MPYNKGMACSQIIAFNPVMEATSACRREYYEVLEKIIRFGGWDKKKYVHAQLSFYHKILVENVDEDSSVNDWKEELKYFIPFDILAILGYRKKWIQSRRMMRVRIYMSSLLQYSMAEQRYLRTVFELPFRNQNFYLLKSSQIMCKYTHYINTVIVNTKFVRKKPYRILVTATMSAGKSTFINALAGKKICKVQNTACTGRIHKIVEKPYEDGYNSIYDNEFCMDTAEDRLTDDSRWDALDNVIVSAYFHGILAGMRLVLYDTPGINYSQNYMHRYLTQKMICTKEYDQLIYLMDATQLGTLDNQSYLKYIKKNAVGKRIVFILNKIDAVYGNDENIFLLIEHCIQELNEAGFQNPVLCPVSAKAAWLAKKSENEKLSRAEKRELDLLTEYFIELGLPDFYESSYPYVRVIDSRESRKQLCKNCGIKYVEQMINIFSMGLEHSF